ncbi:monovalent cation/H+ antiporter complex subunit F [Pseudodesulfovibrio senegalensis]|jgi:multicomponent Na+:H+ antiporter subunit F|uniref:pH regulation protein F n=1 Tax=Pseudodesulfovibrio senegalensis TaxID=1721087 RepID=A0A6N6N4I5_9BACT|nr:monovalent cation/H+ antiporter complex subunit F [Pseudodesulfovibrio senegalensis]KAB1442863.1 pH regulation protein F [Pseudodesulfovibrio senegalensis]
MEHLILFASVFLVMLMMLSLYRTIIGPSTLDRLMGMNAIGAKTTVLILLIGFIFGRIDMFVDIALSYAMLNFIAVLTASRYFQARGMRKRDSNLRVEE